MSKKVAVIASILKPVDDTRLYEKLGLTLSESNKYRVNIIGFGVKNPPAQGGICFHPLYHGPRLGIRRLLAPWKFFLKLIKIRPDLTVVCTPELLLPGVLFKLIFGTKLWYDVQENYQRNVRYQSAYPFLLKPILKGGLWLVETSTQPFVDQYLLAERGYLRELTFIGEKHTVLENKYQRLSISIRPPNNKKVQLIFTGTVSRENGILESISLTQALHINKFPVQLTIVGQVPQPGLLAQIQKNAGQDSLINIVGGGSLVTHHEIMEHAAAADFGLVSHQPNPSTENCIPTKIYEYLGLGLPMLLQSHTLWESVVKPYEAAVIFDYRHFDPGDIWNKMQQDNFYSTSPGPEISWQQEGKKLLALL